MVVFASLTCGLIFGFGLLISGMTQPDKVLGFLNIFGRWDPTLALVMTAALVVSGIGFATARKQRRPMLTAQHLWPIRTDIDRPLVVGSLLFGIGWGLVVTLPRPSAGEFAGMMPSVMIFVLAMAIGMIVKDLAERVVLSRPADGHAKSASADG